MTKLIFLGLLGFIEIGFASSGPQYCKNIFDSEKPIIGAIQVIAPTHQDAGDRIYQEALQIAEVAAELGLATPPHQLNIVPSEQINILATTGGHAAPHWHEGANVLQSIKSVQGVMEFVTKGCPVCRAFYSASTPDIEQRSIIMHVAGHNDMSATSKYQVSRPGDSVLASKHLAQALEKAYRDNPREQVVLYYQFLQSAKWLQDFAFGTFQSPDELGTGQNNSAIDRPAPNSLWDSLENMAGGFFEHLGGSSNNDVRKPTRGSWKKTYSVLQALTANVPSHVPEWQKSILKLFEQRERMYPAVVQTKIMNEGWATLQQYILARHLPWTSSKDLVQYAQLIDAVIGKSLSFENPYSLGLSGWMNLYEQYLKKPELGGLSEKEKDKSFIAWARPFYESKNDSEWARIALDQHWVEKHNLFLYRKTQSEEMDQSQPPDQQKFIALSRNWKRVRNFVIHNYIDAKNWISPNISIRNPDETPGLIYLKQENMEEGVPLDLPSAAKTSFALAQVMQKPIQLEALFAFESSSGLSITAFLLKVHYNGEVQISHLGGSSSDLIDVAKVLQSEIELYKSDLLGSFHEDFNELQTKKWVQLAMRTSDLNSKEALKIVDFAPHTSSAIREYIHLVEKRLRQAVVNSLKAKVKSHLGKAGVALQALPEIPRYTYLTQIIQMQEANKPIGPVDQSSQFHDYDFDVDFNGSIIGSGGFLPGDKFGKPEQEGQGGGEGEGDSSSGKKGKGSGKSKPGSGQGDETSDGEGEETEGEAKSPGKGGGKGQGGGGNPYDLQIPLQLYGELLSEVLELPNIRRTKGKETRDQSIRNGVVMKPIGNLEWDDIIISAIEKARAIRRGKGLAFDSSVPVTTLIKEALPLLEPSDYYVSGEKTIPLPDFEAVIVINIDLTGSMAGERIRLAKNFVYNVKALLAAKYKAVHVVFVGFSDKAFVFSEKDIFSKFIGGGTNYTSAIELDKKILTDYPNSQFNKYLMTIGDIETYGNDVLTYTDVLRELTPDLQYAGLVVTNTSLNGELVNGHQQLKLEWPWIGIAKLSTAADMFQALKDLFPHH